MRQKWYVFASILSIVLLLGIYQWYSSFISQSIYEESIEHLQEIYTQVDRTFASLVVKNWKLLDCWESYMEHLYRSDTEEDVISLIKREKEQWEFTGFYFLDREGGYQTLDGKRGTIDLGSKFSDLMEKGQRITVDGVLQDGTTETVFAIPTKEEHSIKGFRYSAMGVSYSSEAMVQVINVGAFSGQSNCFVVYSNGDVLFSTRISEEQPANLLDYLKENGQMSEEEFDEVRTGLEKRENGNLEYKCKDGTQYLVYMPVGFQDWMLAGMVSKKIVGERLNKVQILTTSVLAAVFIIIFIVGFRMLLHRNKLKLDKKSLDIKYREELFGILSNIAEDIFVMFSKDGYKVEYVSPNFEAITGIPIKEIKSDIRKLNGIYVNGGKEIPLDNKGILDVIPLNGCWQDELEIAHYKTNETHWYCAMLYKVAISDSQKFILVLSDRTAEKRQNQALKQALDIAENANEAKSSFLFNMSHDIRTPMNAIVGYTMLLDKDAAQEERIHDYAHKIMASSQHLLGLINDILDMSKIESGKTKLNTEEFRFFEMLEDVCAVIRPQAKAKGQNFLIKIFSMKEEVLIGDKVRISQVLLNLLSNAVKYTQENGRVELIIENLSQTSRRFARMSFVVRDNGIGMSEEFLKTIYDPFVRERNSTVSKIQGTGLGMAITKNLLDLMGGTISVKSSPGEGSEFTVNISFRVPKQGADKNFWREHDIYRLLAVDADEDICNNICSLMRDTSVEASSAVDGITAVKMAADACEAGNGYSVILVDSGLQEPDGLETVKRIRACAGQDVIIILTAYDREEMEEGIEKMGADAFLAKPFFVSALQQVVERVRRIEDEEQRTEEKGNDSVLKGLHFLVAEDNEINAEILTELLKLEGGSCEIAENGEDAFHKFKDSEPGSFDVILMDVQMPVMNGYQATEAIRACGHPDARTVPIAAMTANAFTEDVENALAAGMDAHISKPIDMNMLRSTVAKMLEKN